jgi:hypothetical protein
VSIASNHLSLISLFNFHFGLIFQNNLTSNSLTMMIDWHEFGPFSSYVSSFQVPIA